MIPDGGAAKAGIKEGDKVIQVDDVAHPNWEDITMKEIANARQPMQIWVVRDGATLHLTATPTLDEKQGVGYLGWMQEMDVQVAGYVPGIDAAERAGLAKGDTLVSVNGKRLRSTASLHEVMKETDGHPVEVVYQRKGQTHNVTIVPVKKDADGTGHERWMLGVAIEPRIEITKLGLSEALYESCRQNLLSAQMTYKFLERMAERRMSPKSLNGPIGIAQLSGDAAREGAAEFFRLMSAVSLQLAIFNLIPIPILDGGTILMLLVEMLLRRDLDLKVKEAVVKVGFLFLMVVVVFVIYNDISKILPPS